MLNKECNTCIYRGERDVGTPIMPVLWIYCDYDSKSKYDKRCLVDNHCNKYKAKETLPNCSLCRHYDNDRKGDCELSFCDFDTEQLSLFGK